jgi:ribosome-associated protein
MSTSFKMWLLDETPGDPMDLLNQEIEFTTARSGGPGGQNVNKVESKAILWWSPGASRIWTNPEQLARFRMMFANRINKKGLFYLASQVHRDQPTNKQECLEGLRSMIQQAMVEPVQRVAPQPTAAAHQRRIGEKLANKQRKASRQFKPEFE